MAPVKAAKPAQIMANSNRSMVSKGGRMRSSRMWLRVRMLRSTKPSTID